MWKKVGGATQAPPGFPSEALLQLLLGVLLASARMASAVEILLPKETHFPKVANFQ